MRIVVKPAVREFARATGQLAKTPRAWRAGAGAAWRAGQTQVRALRDAQAKGAENTKSALTTCMRKLQIIANAATKCPGKHLCSPPSLQPFLP
jgi:hypothetical protein